jgi:rhodanese-related sulfurtransferase
MICIIITGHPSVKAYADVDPSTLHASIERLSAPAILDVRSRLEFEAGHVPGAVNVPFWRVLFGTGAVRTPPHDTLVVYCGHGPRARFAGSLLTLRGFARVAYLKGHMAEWRRRGLPEIRGPA